MKFRSALILALLLTEIPSLASARGLGAKYAIMKGTGDYASSGYRKARVEKMSCSQLAAQCINLSRNKSDRLAKCGGAQSSCQRTGIFVGPYSGRVIPVAQR
jgi:hypothetical protein